MTDKQECGAAGERAAVDWLRHNGFMIVEQNWRAGRYEIDIIASRWGILHIVEVKTRRADSLTQPEDAITEQKFRSLQRAASAYIAQRRLKNELQFDLMAVEMLSDGSLNVRFIENAMQCAW
ncbi:MAG: YraN family protein [Alistipes sp.]